MPGQADKRVFATAPVVVVISTFLVFLVIPMGPDLVVKDLDVGVFYALAVSSLSVIGVLMAGWASANKYALLGALRAAGQLIAYELPLLLAVTGVVVQAGSMNLNTIVIQQQDNAIFGIDWIGNPYILTQFVGFFLFLVAAQAELTQTPFDMIGVWGGPNREYASIKFFLFTLFGSAMMLLSFLALFFLSKVQTFDMLIAWMSNIDHSARVEPAVMGTTRRVIVRFACVSRFDSRISSSWNRRGVPSTPTPAYVPAVYHSPARLPSTYNRAR